MDVGSVVYPPYLCKIGVLLVHRLAKDGDNPNAEQDTTTPAVDLSSSVIAAVVTGIPRGIGFSRIDGIARSGPGPLVGAPALSLADIPSPIA